MPEARAGEVVVRVEAAAVTAGDARIRAGRFPKGFGVLARAAIGVSGPRARVLGAAFSGKVEHIAADVTQFSPGDEVVGMTGARLGAHAEYVRARAATLVRKPAEVPHTDAAGILFGGTTALHFLSDRAHVTAGNTVLVNGASGAVGSAAVQLAKHFGATVTAVTSERNADLAVRLGADRVIDYAKTPVAMLEDRFDIVFDAVGNVSRDDGLRLLVPGGSLILAVASLIDTIRARGQVFAGPAPERREHFALLLNLVAGGQLDPLTEVLSGLESVQEAHRLIDTGRKIGNLVVLPHAGHDAAP